MASQAQITNVQPTMKAFLRPILLGDGRSFDYMGRQRALFLGRDDRKLGRQYGELFGRLLRDRGYSSKSTYPGPDLAWHYAEVFRFAGDRWAAGPLVLYGIGQLEAFVYAIASADRAVLPAAKLLKMMHVLTAAVEGGPAARKAWILSNREHDAFVEPGAAATRLTKKIPELITLALSRARHFDIPYDLQRRTVLGYVTEWLEDLQARAA